MFPPRFALLTASSPAEVEKAYWRIENTVVVQGTLFESAVATTSVFIAALTGSELPEFVRGGVLELLFQIVAGRSDQRERARGIQDYGEQCRSAAREGLWVLYDEMLRGQRESTKEVLELIETDPLRLQAFVRAIG